MLVFGKIKIKDLEAGDVIYSCCDASCRDDSHQTAVAGVVESKKLSPFQYVTEGNILKTRDPNNEIYIKRYSNFLMELKRTLEKSKLSKIEIDQAIILLKGYFET